MDMLLAFIGGCLLAGITALVIVKRTVGQRVRQAEEAAEGKIQAAVAAAAAAAMKAEAAAAAEKARLEADLDHALNDIKEQQSRHEAELQKREEAHKAELKARDDMREAERKKLDEAHKAELQKREEAHREAMETLQKRFDETMEKVSAQVKLDTGEMLKARQNEFSEASRQSIGQLVNPLKENIAELKKAMEEENRQQAERNGEMRERIKNLMDQSDAARKSADELAAAFKHGSKVQGDWGETILEELLSSQGLTRGVHFDTQAVIRDADGHPVRNADGGIMRPDVILHLDERREVIIDSKVSLTAYVDYINAEDEATRRTALKAHVESLKKHCKELAAKDYSAYVQPPKVSAGYVIMFVPNVGALWSALNAEPDLWRKAAEANVYIADEQTLYAALKIVSLTWTQVAQAQNHEKVYELANEMIDRVGQFMERYDAVGKALDKARQEYDAGQKKLLPQGQSILNTSGKLLKLGAKNSDRHPVKALIDIDDIPALPDGPAAEHPDPDAGLFQA